MKRRKKILASITAGALLAGALAFCPDKKEETIENKVEKTPVVALPQNRQKAEVLKILIQGAAMKQREIDLSDYVVGCADPAAENFKPEVNMHDDAFCTYTEESSSCFRACDFPVVEHKRGPRTLMNMSIKVYEEWSEVCGIKHGKLIARRADTDEPYEEHTYVCGTLDGKAIQWDLTGDRTEFNYDHGVLHGKKITYDSNGEIVREENHKHGLKHGRFREYSPDGTPENEMNFKNGIQHGPEKGWFSNGQLRFEKNFVDGREEGLFNVYFSNGTLDSEIPFKNGRMQGWVKFYNFEGELINKQYFDNGDFIPPSHYEKFGIIDD